MAILERSEFLHKRNEKNELLPEIVELEDNSGEVEMTPLVKGEVNVLTKEGQKGKEFDVKDPKQAEIVSRHLVNPKFSTEELLDEGFKVMKYALLAKALLKVSGLDYGKKR